jgi:nitrogenase molybdenum-iron protein alpha/beta subunit
MPRSEGLAAGVATRFSSTYQPPNRGRKPSQLKAWIKENNVSNEDFIAIFTTIIAVHTLEELEEMVNEKNKPKLPVIVALCISAFLRDMKTGTLTAANSILDRIMGKPTQQINFGGSSGTELPADPRERLALAERLKKELELGKLPTVAELEGEKKAAKPKATAKKPKEKN